MLVGALVLAGAMGLFTYAARSVDQVHKGREIELAWLGLQRIQEKTLEDVQSATVWNDAVRAFQRDDREWMQLNFADYYAEYMGHEMTLVYDSDAKMILASKVGQTLSADEETELARTTRPLVQALQEIHPDGTSFDATRSWSGVIAVGETTYLMAMSTVVPEDEVVARPDRDPVVISMRNVSAVVDSFAKDLALGDPAYVSKLTGKQVAFPLVGSEGRRLGLLAWTPSEPGARVLEKALPFLIVLISVLIGAAVLLWVSLDRIARELERNQTDLAEALDRAEAANEAKTRFLANISHELRTPLNGVLGMAEILEHGGLSPIQNGHLKILKASGNDLLRMIEQILLVTRLEQSRVELTVAPFDLDAMLDDLRVQTRAAVSDRSVSVVVDSGARGQWMGDSAYIRQALECLTKNAATFTTAGEIRISSAVKGKTIHLTVSDTGPGLDPEFLPRMFEDFAQADDSITRAHDGAGLGLAICRRLVRAMGGDITVRSELGQGTTFTLWLPLEPAGMENSSLAA